MSLAWIITWKTGILFDTLRYHLYWRIKLNLDIIKITGGNSLMETHEKHPFMEEIWVFNVKPCHRDRAVMSDRQMDICKTAPARLEVLNEQKDLKIF